MTQADYGDLVKQARAYEPNDPARMVMHSLAGAFEQQARDLAAARREKEEMREALRPIVAVLNIHTYDSTDGYAAGADAKNFIGVSIRDLRNAARALSAQPDPHNEENKPVSASPPPPSGLREALEKVIDEISDREPEASQPGWIDACTTISEAINAALASPLEPAPAKIGERG